VSDGAIQQVRMLAGRYEVGALLGHGGMADVHVGVDARLGRRVAIKLLKPALATDPVFRTRFRQEAQAAARMAHPTIVRVFDAGEETVVDDAGDELQVPFIVMEHVDGRLLTDVIDDGPLDPREAARIIGQVLTALEYSHRAGVVHRDIKPGNIMVVANGQVKVMDFGIARAISESSATVAQTTAVLGTAQYFSPEQARGESVDARTDLYSAGVVLFELLTGRPPFRGATPVAVAYQHVSEPPVAPSTLNPAVSPALDAVVLRALAKSRFDRYQSAAELRADVESAAEGQVPAPRRPAGTDAVNVSLFGMAPGASAATDATVRQLTVDEDERVHRTQARPPVAWIWGGIATMAVIVIAVVFWVLTVRPLDVAVSASVEVPDVVGQQSEEAVGVLTDARLDPQQFTEPSETVAEGVVIRTDPEGDGANRVAVGQRIVVYISSGRPTAAVPAASGLPLADVQAALTNAGLQPGAVTEADSATIAEGSVVELRPVDAAVEDGQLPQGTTVDIVVSTGNASVPDVRGQSSAQANTALRDAGFQVSVSVDRACRGGTVSSQSPGPGPADQGSAVTIRVCAGG